MDFSFSDEQKAVRDLARLGAMLAAGAGTEQAS
jgi:hypothetical protein